MKLQMSLKWRLTLSVLLVLIPIGIALGLLAQFMLAGFDQRLFEALTQRALANTKAVESEITFEIAARLKDEIEKKLKIFFSHHKEVHAITIAQKDGTEFVHIGAQIDLQEILAAFPDRSKEGSKRVGRLIVAITPVVAEGQEADSLMVGDCVIYTESLEDYFTFRTQIITFAFLVGLAGLVIIMIGAYVAGNASAKPIFKLVSAAQRIADGDLEHIDVATRGSMETAALASSIQAMASALQKQVIAIKRLTTEITSTSRDVAGTMAHLASSASEQAAAVTETAATVEEMEQAGRSAAGNANQIVDAAEKTTEASIRGREAVETTNAIILRIKDDSQDISDKSKNLLSAVEEVGNIIRSVNAIAEQSKILAVNASIEAAKAGEFGSGFAVVAQEVKDLAQQSKDATLQITGTLTAIRQAIETMVATAQSGKERTEEGVNMIANAGAIMNDLAEAIRENSDFANVIATNINQQTIGLTQIATSIEEINSTALENQNISRKIVESTTQMTESFELLNKMVGNWRTPTHIDDKTE